jgi:uncharacterized membrane protein
MSERGVRLERALEIALSVGLGVSTVLLLAGIVIGSQPALEWGTLLLIVTPMLRVLVLTAGLALQRDWRFALLSLLVLVILASGSLSRR